MVTDQEGTIAVSLARRIIDGTLDHPYGADLIDAWKGAPFPPLFLEKRGVFVTLETYPGKDLRGCIGFSTDIYPLGEAIARAAWLAAREDPRFPPVSSEEVDNITIEVSVLGPLERIRTRDPRSLAKEVVVGRDGLFIFYNGLSGLLLPQVPVDQGWTADEFLEGICHKAGLPGDTWRRKGPEFWRFRTEVFVEERPRGPVRALKAEPRSV